MIRPKKMKRIELTVLTRDVDAVIEYVGKRALMHMSLPDNGFSLNLNNGGSSGNKAEASLEHVKRAALYLGVALPEEPGELSQLPTADDDALARSLASRVDLCAQREEAALAEGRKVEEAAQEARAFARLKAPFGDLEHLSYLTLRVGRLDPKRREELSDSLGDRAVIVPLGDNDRILAASSKKGRFALDSELKKIGFEALSVPTDFAGVPAELLTSLDNKLEQTKKTLENIAEEKKALTSEYADTIKRLVEAYLMAQAVNELKANLQTTQSSYSLSGWVAAASVRGLADDLARLTDGRLALRSYEPNELVSVRDGEEKVPVALDHGAFVGGFERVVFSYGAPLYGTIDPTPFVALSFTLLFGLMFGDVGQGFVLLMLGLAASRHGLRKLAGFRRFASPLMAVGTASMLMGLLDGEVFANDTLLIRPTRLVTAFLTGHPVDRVLHLMPEAGSVEMLFAFFGFTIGIGVLINSIGLIINIVNNLILKRYEKAFFAKTGLSGALLFWYALGIAVRILMGGGFAWWDYIGLGLPVFGLFFGTSVFRLFSGRRPVFEHGLMASFMEGFVEVLESTSYYLSNTVSFLRVGAFALSHAVLSFIVFALSDMIAGGTPAGAFFGFIVMVIGNALIILLEGLIVAIQVVRLQYYEFFSKFFTDTGVEFAPFRFRREVKS